MPHTCESLIMWYIIIGIIRKQPVQIYYTYFTNIVTASSITRVNQENIYTCESPG
jgi:hypothetical protein